MHEIVKNMSIFIFEEHPWNKRFQLEEKIFCAQFFPTGPIFISISLQ